MAVELVAHTSLSQHSPPFSLAGATAYSVDVTGTLADGGIELQMLVNGSYVPLSPPISFLSTESGGTKQTGLLPANAQFRWTVKSGVNNATTANCKITSVHK
jgi:hypothetical protein